MSHAAPRVGEETAVGPAESAALRLLARVALLANEATAVGPCLARALREVCEHAGWDVGHAWLVAADGSGELVSSGRWYLSDAERFEPFCAATATLRLPPGAGLPGRVLARGTAEAGVVRGDGSDAYAEWLPSRVAPARTCRLRSGLAFPIWIAREPAGVLEFFARADAAPDPATLDVLAQVGHQLGRVIERERSLHELQRREAHLSALLGSLADVPVCVLDRDARILEWFGGTDKGRWGLPASKAIGRVASEWFGEESYAPVAALVREVAATGEPRSIEKWFELPRGRFCFDIRFYPIPGTSGESARILALNQDVTERRLAEEAQREGERRYQALAEAAPVGISRLDRQGRLVYRNRLMAEVSGFSEEAMANGAWLASLQPGDTEQWRRRIESLVENPEPRQLEYAVARPDGSKLWVLSTTVPEYDEAGQCSGFVSCVLDISERKAAEDALRESERRYQTLAEAVPVGLARLDAEGRVVYRNEQLRQLTGLADDAFGEATPYPALLPEARARHVGVLRELRERPTPRYDEHALRRADGSLAWVLTRTVPEFDAQGRCVGYLCCVLDISERKAAEDALRESERRFQSLAEALPVGVCRADSEGRITQANQRFWEIAGLAPDELMGADAAEQVARHLERGRVVPDEIERLLPVIQRAASEGTPCLFEMRWKRREDGWRWLQARSEPEFDAGGTCVGVVGTLSDVTDLKLAEEALRASERRFHTLAESLPVGVWRTDREGRSVYENRRMVELLDVEPDQLLGLDSAERMVRHRAEGRMDPGDLEHLLEGFGAAVQAQQPYAVEYGWRCRDGSERWLALRAVPEFDANGAFVGHVGTVSDVTERRLAEQALRESEHRFHTLAESLPVGVWRTDREGRSVYENRRMAELLDMGSELLVGFDASGWMERHIAEEQVDPGEIDGILGGFERAVRERKPLSLEYRWRLRDGGVRWLHLRAEPEFDASGAFVGHVGTVSDITERKLAEQALRESEHRYQTLAEAMGVGVYRIDRDGRTIYANRRLWEMLEREPRAIPTGDIAQQLAEISAEGRMEAAGVERLGRDARRALDTQQPLTTEVRWRAKDGSTRWILLRAEPEFDADGAFRGVVTTATDVTELKRAEQELARHRDHLGELVAERTAELERSHEALRRSERLAAVGTFAAGIAHQINNPVGGILLAAQFAGEDPGDRERVAGALADIAQDARHVGRIVRGVLEFARGPTRAPEPCDLNGAVGACAGQLAQDAAERGVVLELELAEHLPRVLGNASALEQVITNLVWNSIEASARSVRVRTAVVDDGILLEVRDDGEGIAAEHLDRIFDPLFTTRARRGGTGLGLALAHGIVQAHAGRIAVATRRGEGTTITIVLPRAPSDSGGTR